MILNNAFEVSAPPGAVFDFMMDPERVVPTIPGATFKGAPDEDHWSAEVKANLGPMSLKFKGDVEVVKRDRDNYDMALKGKGREVTGKGKASADISTKLIPQDGGGTRVEITTDLSIVGKAAQFGGPLIEDVAAKFTEDFASNMERALAAETKVAAAEAEGDEAAAEAAKEELAEVHAEAAKPVSGIALFFQLIARFFRNLFGGQSA
ncbi:MAG: SRPBCC family protein [Myxococcota bacterium]